MLDLFQNTEERISEGFVRDKVPEIYRQDNGYESFKNHLENKNIQELPSQNTKYNVNQYDVVGLQI